MPNNNKKHKSNKEWKPKPKSGAWAILVALYLNTEVNEYLDIEILKRMANQYSNSSMYPDPDKKYSYCAWSSNTKLIEHGLIIRKLKPTRFCLSEKGRLLSKSLIEESKEIIPIPRSISISSIPLRSTTQYESISSNDNTITNENNTSTTLNSCKFSELFEGKYETIEEIYLLIDNREKKARDEKFFEVELNKRNISTTTRQLSVGDFVWIGKTKEGNEVILDTIIERKSIDDLCSSIISKRYSEQKWRLSHSGIPNIIYLVEGSVSAWSLRQSHSGNLTVNSVEMALISTHSVDEFTVIQTQSTLSTVSTICRIHENITNKWIGRRVIVSSLDNVKYVKVKHNKITEAEKKGHSIIDESDVVFTFSQFQEHNMKNKVLPIRDTFGLQLMACNRCSADAAVAIVDTFKTPSGLAKAYYNASCDEERKSLLKSIKMKGNRNIGKQLSLNIWDVFWGR